MKNLKFALAAALIGASTAALAIDTDSEANRQQRMDDALQTYRSGDARNTNPGRFARAEESTKRGFRKAGAAIKRGAEKTGDALHRTGEKIEDKLTPAK